MDFNGGEGIDIGAKSVSTVPCKPKFKESVTICTEGPNVVRLNKCLA
jgi:hypothetical protein